MQTCERGCGEKGRAHTHAGGRWLATGGGGYDVYRVVPRSWSLVWLAGAHRDVPDATPVAWRERWAPEGARYGQAPLPDAFEDLPNAGYETDSSQAAAEARSLETVGLVRRLVVPRLLQVARDRGWWDPVALSAVPAIASESPATARGGAGPEIIRPDADTWARLTLARRTIAPAERRAGHALILAALRDGASVSAAVDGSDVVGLAIGGPVEGPGRRELLTIGVEPGSRRQGLAGALLEALVTFDRQGSKEYVAEVTLAERDPVEPLDRSRRADVARRLLERAGFQVTSADQELRRADPGALTAVRPSI